MFGIGIPELVILIPLLLLYFLPSFIAKFRNHQKFRGILILNILVGWTLIGWIPAFIWAWIDPAESHK